jgi:CheY-like chemotaxis protein
MTVRASMAMKITILEDNEDRQTVMRDILEDRFWMYDVRLFDDAGTMIRFLQEHLADTLVISLDHDLDLKPGPHGRCIDPGTGREVADYLARQAPVCPVIIHTTNSQAALGMELVLKDARWKTRRVVPFSDLEWIESSWFPAIRRAIVGPIQKPIPPRTSTS